jgi:Leucine-rich repeat (LRR) protein
MSRTCQEYQDNVFFQNFSNGEHKNLPDVKRPKIVQSVNLSCNQISEIPDTSQLLNLKVLNLSGNMLTSLVGMACLRRLERLDVSKNALKSLEGVEVLKSLKVLSASNNEIRSLSGLQALTNLETLELSGNVLRVDSFAQFQLGSMKQLKFVDLSNNSISRVESLSTALPRSIEVLLLEGNHLFTISSLFPLGIFTRLRALQITKNSCISDRPMKAFLLFLMPSLASINNVPINDINRSDAAKLFKKSITSIDWDDESLVLVSNENE